MRRAFLALALVALTAPAAAQQAPASPPGAADPARVKAGEYKLDPAHTQVVWTVNHFGINAYTGIFGDVTGTLSLDPAKPAASKLSVTIPLDKVTTTSAGLTKHLMNADFFEVAKYPAATFVSTRIEPNGTRARITGDLTLHGVTKPVTLDAQFVGAGDNPMNKAPTVGFEATASINRSDFGMGYGIPMVADRVDLRITAAFERQS